MTESVYHTGYDIELNLSLDDLGHPDLPGLWEEIYRPKRFDHGLLRCMGLGQDGVECPEAMYVKIRNGKRIACHVNSSVGPHTANEGPRHKVLKERIATAAQRAGFEAILEDSAAEGTRRTDVLVKGQGGRAIGWEVQLYHITANSVRKRSRRAYQHGITPMWTVEDRKSEAVDRAPWTRLDRVTDWRQIAGRHLNVRGGVRELRMERCDERRPTPCPERKRGRCGGWHACWDLALGVYLDDLIARTAGGEYVPFFLPSNARRGGNHMWVTTKDKNDFLQGRPEPSSWTADLVEEDEGGDRQIPRELDPDCHYGEHSTVRSRRARRDVGEWIDAAAWLSTTAEAGTGLIGVADRYVPPQDLIDLRNAFVQADQLCGAVAAEMPSSLAIVHGTANIDDELRARLDRARGQRRHRRATVSAPLVDNRGQPVRG